MKTCRVMKKPITGNSWPILVAIYIYLWPCSLNQRECSELFTELFNDPSPVLCIKVIKLFRTDRSESQSLRIFYMNYLIINKVFTSIWCFSICGNGFYTAPYYKTRLNFWFFFYCRLWFAIRSVGFFWRFIGRVLQICILVHVIERWSRG